LTRPIVEFIDDAGRRLGTAYTNDQGVAAVSAPVNAGSNAISNLVTGYWAYARGDCIHTPAQSHAFITAGTDCW
jgi:hypothetical protein